MYATIRNAARQFLISITNRLGYRIESLKAPRFTAAHILEEALRSRSQVSLLQVGAHDGMRNDPVFHLRKQPGWSGIMVEANPFVFQSLRSNLAPTPNMKSLNVALAPVSGQVEFSRVNHPEKTKCPAWADQISSLSRHHVVATLVDWGHSTSEAESLVTTERVTSITFDDLLSQHPFEDLTLLLLDVEGMDYDLLKLFPFQKIKPEWILFESSHLIESDRETIPGFLAHQGYSFVEVGGDIICRRWN